MLRQIIMYCEL